ncbi:MAG: TonB-dependent receptor [Chitinophagaceae bacterium]
MKKYLFIIACFSFTRILAQTETTVDTVQANLLQEVIVRGYDQNRRLKDVGAAVNVINQQQLQRYGVASFLPAVNASPGVRMEERSPGSYRLNIRGSSLRSPFGVRNVKIYWNDIPFTDPGGNTYLNQLSLYNFSSVEILKGPGSSLYGAGTGGVMLINSFPDETANKVSLNYSGGSYGAQNINVSAIGGNESFRNMVSYTHQTSNGYRDQSAMRRDVVTWDTRIKANEKQTISTHVLYGDVYYQTPGALTKPQYLVNPKAARPAGGGFPSAQQNMAAITQKTFWAGINQQYNFNSHWRNITSVYGAFSQVQNPTIRNYERRLEPNFGGRTTFSYSISSNETTLKVLAGAEFQQGYSTNKVYKNKLGVVDSIQTDDEVNNKQLGVFLQTDITLPRGWIVTAGVSSNKSNITFQRLSLVPSFVYKTNYDNELAPRVSLLKKINARLSVYGLVSKGFSPPTISELLPSTSVINTDLQAEHGINYELGFRGSFFKHLSVDINAFYFRLQNSITARRDASGADYFTNAGNTKQQGIETALNYQIGRNEERFISQCTIWFSHTYQHFRYKDFKQVATDFSGKQIPGIAPHTVATGIDFVTKPGWYAGINYFYSDRIALNDANSEFASSYNLLGFKTGYKVSIGKHVKADVFVSGDNLFNQTYSLGNDINAAVNRFYNAAPGVNYQAGIGLQFL